MSTCATCGKGGQTGLVAGLQIYRHYKPADHRFVPTSKSPADAPRAPRAAGSAGHFGAGVNGGAGAE